MIRLYFTSTSGKGKSRILVVILFRYLVQFSLKTFIGQIAKDIFVCSATVYAGHFLGGNQTAVKKKKKNLSGLRN